MQQIEETLVRCIVERGSHIGIFLGHLRVALFDAWRRLQQSRSRDRFNMADCENGVAIAGEDYLALLGELETAVDGADRLSQDRSVRRAAATTDGTATTVEERQINVVAPRPLGDAFLSGMQCKGRGCRASILG